MNYLYLIKRLWVILLLPSVFCFTFYLSTKERTDPKLKIGIPDSTGGLIFQYVLLEKMSKGSVVFQEMSAYPIKDCCTTTSEWALSSGSLQMAVMCPDSAQRLVKKDPRYEILGPCALNTDIMILRNKFGVAAKKIAVSQGRDFQKTLVRKLLGEKAISVPVMTSAIPYAYAKGVVDGAVIDILKGFQLQGEMIPSSKPGENLVTYVLVIRKAFKENSLYQKFFNSYKEALDELNNKEVLHNVVMKYGKVELTEERLKKWKEMKVRFILPISRGLDQ